MTKKSGKNYLPSVFYLILTVIIILLALDFIPASFTDKYHLRHIDILSDIRKEEPEITQEPDSIPEPPRLDTCRYDLTCFEDFSLEQNGLDAFFEALNSKKKIRVAFFGDSFIEGDIFCGDLREKLQDQFGGRGVGMMPLSSNVSSFRQTVIHQYKGWKVNSITDSKTPEPGIGGNVFLPQGDHSWVYYGGSEKKQHLDSCQRVSIFYNLKTTPVNISYKLNKGEESGNKTLTASGLPERLNIDYQNIGNVEISFPAKNDLLVYGISLEDLSGISVDNFSIRGYTGLTFNRISTEMLTRFDSLLNYDLIILGYGLNVMEANRTNYKWFRDNMIKSIQHLQASFPNAGFLLIGVSDRSMRKDGEYKTMPGVPAMVSTQREICAETNIVFWNLYEAMGGENSMIELVNSKPPKANKDYTHLTFAGGAFLGNKLYETIIFEKELYDKKKDYYNQINK